LIEEDDHTRLENPSGINASQMSFKKSQITPNIGGQTSSLVNMKRPEPVAEMPYWRNRANQRIIEKFNKFDLDVRMKIVGSNVLKSNTHLKAHSTTKLPKINPSKSRGHT
jgi:hypothetical protein